MPRSKDHIRQFYQADWGAPEPFHLILNTTLLSEGTCIRLVMDAVDEINRPQTG